MELDLETLIDDYDRLLDAALARDLFEHLRSFQQRHGMLVGPARDRLVCAVLRPRLITARQYAALQSAAAQVGRAIRAVGAAAVADEALLAPYALGATERELLRIEPGYAGAALFGRLDGFLAPDGSWCYFVESNLESPAGVAYDEALAQAFDQTEVMVAFRRMYRAEPLPVRQALEALLLECYHHWGGQGTPTVAIVDYGGAVTYSEFEWLRDHFIQDGIPTIIADPGELRYAGGRLLAGDTPIDLVYRRVLQHEFLARYDLSHALIRAYADRAVCVVNPLRTKPVHTKLIMWLLSDEDGPAAGLLDQDMRAAVDRHVPWSRLVARGPTRYAGERVDLLAFARQNRERLVLKPNDDYGGKGVLLGWETSQAAWERGLEEALGAPFLLQERVPVPVERYPTWSDEGGLQFAKRYVDADPCIFGDSAAGCLTRIAATALLNVSAGGGSAPPTFLVQPRTGA
jgi:uncharacterized circularly permuted ATP-grasp superfamily protein